MKISELNVGQGNVEVEGTISEIGETRTFNKFGRDLTVANAILKDDSGSIKLSLWNDDVSRFKNGDQLKVINGYVNEFQGEKQLTSGKFGSLEKVEGGEDNAPAEESKPVAEASEEDSLEVASEEAVEEPETETSGEESDEPEEPKEEVF